MTPATKMMSRTSRTPGRPCLSTLAVAAVAIVSAARTGAQDAALARQPVLTRPQIAQVRTIPNVVGKPVNQAIPELSSTGLTLVLIDSVTRAVDPGTVLAQRPRAGTPVSRAKVESLWVSQAPRRLPLDVFRVDPNRLTPKPDTTVRLPPGDDVQVPKDTVVPNLVGSTGQIMMALLRRATLRPGRSSRDYSDEQPVGRVYQQSPEAGTRVPIGSPVDVWFSIGPHPTPDTGVSQPSAPTEVRVPGLLRLTRQQTERALDSAGLTLGNIAVAGEEAAATVTAQDPVAGTRVLPGSPVHITLGRVSPDDTLYRVPHVIALDLDSASALIRRAGFSRIAVSGALPGAALVDSQSPRGGTLARRTALITLIAVPVPLVDVPRLLDLTESVAEIVALRSGLFDSVRTRNRAFRLREAVVFQSPASGRVPSGSVIAIDVETPIVPPPVLVATAGVVLLAGAGLTVRRVTKRPDPRRATSGVTLAAVVTEPTSPTFILPDRSNSVIQESVRLRYLVEQTSEPLVVDNDSLIDTET